MLPTTTTRPVRSLLVAGGKLARPLCLHHARSINTSTTPSRPSPSATQNRSYVSSTTPNNDALPVNPPVQAATATATSPTSSPLNVDIRPYKDKKLREVLNSYLVFKACTVQPLVKHSGDIIDAVTAIRMSTPLYALIKSTFFRHFCGGENLTEVLPTMEAFRKQNIGSILDLAMEADIDEEAEDGLVSAISPEEALRRADKIVKMMMESIDIAAQQPDSYIAVKATAIVPAPTLQRWSDAINDMKYAFLHAAGKFDPSTAILQPNTLFAQSLTRSSFETMITNLASKPSLTPSEMDDLFSWVDRDGNGSVDWIDVSDVINVFNPATSHLLISAESHTNPTADVFSKYDQTIIETVTPQLFKLSKHGVTKDVRIMIDAEQTYFQPAIDDLTIHLCRSINPPIHNSSTGPIVYTTYQLYLKDALARLMADVHRAHRNNFSLGIKIVRGAYMSSERARASQLGLPDPINNTIEDSHSHYNNAIEFLVGRIGAFRQQEKVAGGTTKGRPLSVVVATHNAESVRRACDAMERAGIVKDDGSVAFAQLMGMKDVLSFGVAAGGFKVYKVCE
ncbi:hypothetical protein HK102_006672 [Quaeritorhiza haematococci]|nr:hypothetical protein HK102_006672 [Quaeritorhiza haematococci]